MFLLSLKPTIAPFDEAPSFDSIMHSEPIDAGK
jgi:hypothetical protein